MEQSLAGHQSVVTCRALRISVFLPLAKPLLRPGGIAVSMQTPNLEASLATSIARKHGLEVIEFRDYQLPDGEPRRLVVTR